MPDSSSASSLGKVDKGAVEACLDLALQALALVMAGSGHLPTFRLFTHLMKRAGNAAAGEPLVACIVQRLILPAFLSFKKE